MQMRCLGTWLSGRLGGARLMVGLDDFKRSFPTQVMLWFYDLPLLLFHSSVKPQSRVLSYQELCEATMVCLYQPGKEELLSFTGFCCCCCLWTHREIWKRELETVWHKPSYFPPHREKQCETLQRTGSASLQPADTDTAFKASSWEFMMPGC